MTQDEFSTLIRLDRSYISQLEKGRKPILEDVQRRIVEMENQLQRPPESTFVLNEKAARPVRRVPVVSFARAGEGANFDDLANHIDETVPTDSRDLNAFAMIIEGHSMEPAFFPGDRVVIEPNSEARSGDVVLARESEGGNVWLKKLKLTGLNGGTVQLLSYNPEYETIERPRTAFRFIYPVVERKLRR